MNAALAKMLFCEYVRNGFSISSKIFYNLKRGTKIDIFMKTRHNLITNFKTNPLDVTIIKKVVGIVRDFKILFYWRFRAIKHINYRPGSSDRRYLIYN